MNAYPIAPWHPDSTAPSLLRISCAGPPCRCRANRWISSTASSPSAVLSRLRRNPAVPSIGTPPIVRCRIVFFSNSDGEMLIVPQLGRLRIATELGIVELMPLEIAVIPRGLRFRVDLLDSGARGYICENYGAPFRLPDLGPIGSNGLARSRDFLTPTAWYEDIEGQCELITKFTGSLWSARLDHSPLDVVAWHGNNAPYKYDLRRFNALGSISYDHPDPSIFLVLQSLSDTPGVDDVDFVVFPPRWLVMTDTFRPPWFHRNIASEFMGLIEGKYDAKDTGFAPGGASLHNCMSGHGPDAATVERASTADTRVPEYLADTMAFMFEPAVSFAPVKSRWRSPSCRMTTNAAGTHCQSVFRVVRTPGREPRNQFNPRPLVLDAGWKAPTWPAAIFRYRTCLSPPFGAREAANSAAPVSASGTKFWTFGLPKTAALSTGGRQNSSRLAANRRSIA